ncbi:MAG: monovalent cation/H(+) antiporter subunit G [Fimbriimonadaceae bacterium]|nr:monovalent cation/H(+) antiporter subunit G [Fimbriimonadaceae bacterium]
MRDAITVGLLAIGSVFALLSAIGLVRFPDLFMRMQASTKATTLGIGCLMLAVAWHFGEIGVATRSLLVVLFVFLTAPAGAHMIARAAYVTGVPLWQGTLRDDLAGKYDIAHHELEGVAKPDEGANRD